MLIAKYSRPGPRYTSYPTPPNWNPKFGPEDFKTELAISNKTGHPLSLYFHIPFCEERCTFCACSVVATKKHEVAEPYLNALFQEIERISDLIAPNRKVEQLHWGGGTPTYLNCKQIESLAKKIKKHFRFSNDAEISIEVDPRVTSKEQLALLRELGWNRMSLGVQDFDPEVQKLAGRIQSEAETAFILNEGRRLGFQSINIDLVYGLPGQTTQTFQQTLKKVIQLNPDRVALFHFAYVPWMHSHQNKIAEVELPNSETKMKMFCDAIQIFGSAGFAFIGLDHFAKQNDELYLAQQQGTMYRNFQGYTTRANCDLIGLGVTSISSVGKCFAQNAKKLKDYQEAVATGLATQHGTLLTEDDQIRQWVIRELFCHQKIRKNLFQKQFSKNFDGYFKSEMEQLKAFQQDGLVELKNDSIQVTSLGRLFLRNIGMHFDAYLKTGSGKFSKTI